MWWSKPLTQNALSYRNLKLALCGLAMAALAGCAASAPKPATPLPTEHFAVKVEEAPDQVALAVHTQGISANQQTALADFVARWREAGSGLVVLKTPADAADADAAKSMTYAVQAQLQGMGVPADRIELAAYNAGGPKGPVLAVFRHLVAEGPDCSGGWDNLTSTMDNEPYKHFGCALTANLAAQVADPRDLVAPSGLSPADNTRRQQVLAKYREGKLTASEKDDQASGTVSSAVKP
jgi:pilus assembly protein CpaD